MQDADRAAGGTGALYGKLSATPEPGAPNYGNWVWCPSDVAAPWDALGKEPNGGGKPWISDWKESRCQKESHSHGQSALRRIQ